MKLYTSYSNSSIEQLLVNAVTRLGAQHQAELEKLLNLSVIKSLQRLISESERSEVQSLIRADSSRLSFWLDERYPSAKLAISESLTRILLSLTVE